MFPELPEIEVADLEIERPVVEIKESDVDDMIKTLREQRRSWSMPVAPPPRVIGQYRVPRPAGDQRIPDSGERELQPVLGSGALFKSFEQALTGLEAGHREDRGADLSGGFR